MGNKLYCLFTSYGEDFREKDHGEKQGLRKTVVFYQCPMGKLGCEVGLR